MRGTDEEVNFNKVFDMGSRESKVVSNLGYLGQYFALEIISNPSLLENDWKDIVNMILAGAYTFAGIDMPVGMLNWCEDDKLMDMDESIESDVRATIVVRLLVLDLRSRL